MQWSPCLNSLVSRAYRPNIIVNFRPIPHLCTPALNSKLNPSPVIASSPKLVHRCCLNKVLKKSWRGTSSYLYEVSMEARPVHDRVDCPRVKKQGICWARKSNLWKKRPHEFFIQWHQNANSRATDTVLADLVLSLYISYHFSYYNVLLAFEYPLVFYYIN